MRKNRKKSILLLFFLCIGIGMFVSCLTLKRSDIAEKTMLNIISVPFSEEQQEEGDARAERLKKLLPRYYKNPKLGDYYIENSFLQGFRGIDDRYLQEFCANVPICAVVRVTAGMENAISERTLLSWYNKYYGTEETKLTQEQKCTFLQEYPALLNHWDYGSEITMEVEEYLFDRTGEHVPELTVKIKSQTPYGNQFRGCTGMRLVCFFELPDQNQTKLYRTTSYYGYFLTEGNYLVPMDINFFEDMVRYGGLSLKEYKKLIQDYYELSEKE